jgi:hypothetical protein
MLCSSKAVHPTCLSCCPSGQHWLYQLHHTPKDVGFSSSLPDWEHPLPLLHPAKSCSPFRTQLKYHSPPHKGGLMAPLSVFHCHSGIPGPSCSVPAPLVQGQTWLISCPALSSLLSAYSVTSRVSGACPQHTPHPHPARIPRGNRCISHPAGRLWLHPPWLCMKL